MSRNNEHPGRLSGKDRELVAIGAAIASNCIPCLEYHTRQARMAGLSDFEIGEAVALADNVRRVPADKVLQTAAALLDMENGTRIENDDEACACSDEAKNSGDGQATGPGEPHANDVRLDNEPIDRDNVRKTGACGDDAKDSTHTTGSEKASAGSRKTAENPGFDLSKMMEMMQKCCPDKMRDFSSIMSGLDKGCCSPGEKTSSKDPE